MLSLTAASAATVPVFGFAVLWQTEHAASQLLSRSGCLPTSGRRCRRRTRSVSRPPSFLAHDRDNSRFGGATPARPGLRRCGRQLLVACTNNFLLAVTVFDGPQDAVICTMEWTTIVGRRHRRGRTKKRHHGERQRHDNLPSADHQFPLDPSVPERRDFCF
jgi:hypothetical protein